MRVGRIDTWDATLLVETGFVYTHLILDHKGKELEIELDKKKVQELIKLLEKSIK
jgi:hypothetical protein